MKEACKAIVKTTVDIYNAIRSELLPTPDKPHYVFNMRDLTRLFQGMLMVQPAKITVRISE